MPEPTQMQNRTVLMLVLAAILLGVAVAFEVLMITWPISTTVSSSVVASPSPNLDLNVSSNASCSVSSGVAPITSPTTPKEGAQTPPTTPTPSTPWGEVQALVARLEKQWIPGSGQAADYGARLTDAGYQTLLAWNNDLNVEPSYADAFESLDLRLPCCDWSKPSRDEKTNCGCGHHQALEGLGKKLSSEGRTREAVQQEVTKWSNYFFPK